MFKNILAFTFFMWLAFPFQGKSQNPSVMSYNIKYDNTNDTVNNWNDRKAAMVTLIKSKSPSFIGMQEVLFNQLQYLEKNLTDYTHIGVGREDGKTKGEFSPIFYNHQNFKLLESNTFWLSKTPDKISVGWDAALERICTYGLFQSKIDNQKVWVFNTHFDHIGIKARKKSVQLILKKIKKLNHENHAVVLMGDFNLTPNEKPILILKNKINDGKAISKTALEGPVGTFNNFDTKSTITKRIDYIFINGLEVENYQHIDKRLPSKKHISDHLPVFTTLKKI